MNLCRRQNTYTDHIFTWKFLKTKIRFLKHMMEKKLIIVEINSFFFIRIFYSKEMADASEHTARHRKNSLDLVEQKDETTAKKDSKFFGTFPRVKTGRQHATPNEMNRHQLVVKTEKWTLIKSSKQPPRVMDDLETHKPVPMTLPMTSSDSGISSFYSHQVQKDSSRSNFSPPATKHLRPTASRFGKYLTKF